MEARLKRRAFLALGILVLTAGCVGFGGGLSNYRGDGEIGRSTDGHLAVHKGHRSLHERHRMIHQKFLERTRERRLDRQKRARKRRRDALAKRRRKRLRNRQL